MDSDGGFHEVEKNGKLLQLEYHHPKYNPIPIPQTPSLTLSGEADHPPQPFFLCPLQRLRKHPSLFARASFLLNVSPECVSFTTTTLQDEHLINHDEVHDHPVLPLFWCNNKKFDVDGGCLICGGLNFGRDYYFCVHCDYIFHKECVESPLKIKHPYHLDHSLQLYYINPYSGVTIECSCCGRRAQHLVYYCNICQAGMHPICAMKPIPFVIDQPKRHHHPLTFFPRQTSLVCNVCGLLRKNYPTYVCLRCNFVAHNDCMYSPSIIKISRHHHRISYISSLPSGEWVCGVCRRRIDGKYGAYICDNCGDYVVHSRCALRKDVCDGKELEGVPEDDITQDDPPFDVISEGVILHFLHDHHLQLKAYLFYEENKLCQSCLLPIYEGNLYACIECDFIFHEACANAPRRIQHALHPHLLTLKANSGYSYGAFECDACVRDCGGFDYQCKECKFDLDVRCASISEPFVYKGHEHPLFLSLDPEEKPTCHLCKSEFLWGEEVCGKDWCEICERNLGDTSTKLFYWCNDCCTTLHIECLLGEDPYLMPGQVFKIGEKDVQILGKSNLSRPFCNSCKNPCQGNIFFGDNRITCSWRCARKIMYL
ncbi:hypothetical protein AALP_AA2G022900 [Arabis alpina]|uniref:Phorbol-ester/DAG-type domain-containing protein n=1 Tax=Arabis alpina TaxID=50452 RepID=A0A087HET9_ARAAL|nr:hypothetical protein AALP_AA2G022900 [Arabis alpina]